MRTSLSYLPFLIAASVACVGTDPSVSTDAVAETATTESSDLFTSNVAAAASEDADFALATNVVVQEDDGDDGADESFNTALVRMQKSKVLSEQFAARAAEALSRSDLKGALVLYSEAVQMDPSNQSAREGFRKVEAMMGDPLAQGGEAFASEADRYLVKQTMTRARAEEWDAKGEAAMRAGDYDRAIESFRQAETILRIDPLIATNSLDERLVSNKLKEALIARDEAEQLELAQQRSAAAEEVARMEAAERDRVRNKLSSYYERANSAFMAENYDEASKFAQLILVADPGSEAAQELLETSRAAGHAKVDERQRRDYREEWLRTFDDLRTMDVPQTQPLIFDLDRWKEVSQRRSFSSIQIETAIDPERAAVLERLNQTVVPARFGDEDGPAALSSVANFLQAQSGVNFQISSLVYDEIGEDEVAVDLDVSDRSVTQILDMIALLTEGMSWKIEDGVVLFVTDSEMTGGQVSATYSVADLVTPIPDYPGPDINISPSDGLPSRRRTCPSARPT